MRRGNIRITPEVGGVNLSTVPSKAQKTMLRDYISRNNGEIQLDIDDEKGNTVVSVEYPRRTSATKILNDITAYFENGVAPTISEYGQFRYQSRGGEFFDTGDMFEDDDSIENVFAKEYAKHSEDIGEVLRNIVAIDIAPNKVESIIRRVVRNSLGGIDSESYHLNRIVFFEKRYIGKATAFQADKPTYKLRRVLQRYAAELYFSFISFCSFRRSC